MLIKIMKPIKCSKCGKSFEEIRFYRDWFMDIKKAVLSSPVCLNCSRELVNQSKKYFKILYSLTELITD